MTEMGRKRQWGTNWGGGDRWRREADREREANETGREVFIPPPQGSGEEVRALRPRLGL